MIDKPFKTGKAGNSPFHLFLLLSLQNWCPLVGRKTLASSLQEVQHWEVLAFAESALECLQHEYLSVRDGKRGSSMCWIAQVLSDRRIEWGSLKFPTTRISSLPFVLEEVWKIFELLYNMTTMQGPPSILAQPAWHNYDYMTMRDMIMWHHMNFSFLMDWRKCVA